jgi:putative membrane protein
MQSLAAKFLTYSEQQTITEAVQKAEKQTSGEIVPMIVSASHDYPLAAATGATLISLPLALLLTSFFGSALWLGSQNMYLFLAFFALLYLPIRAVVNRIPAIKRIFLSNRQVDEEVEEAAITSFYGEKLYRTRHENGILLFVSVLERRVWILGDAGINEKIYPDQWQEIVEKLTKGIRDGHQCEALCQSVTCVGDILKKHFPIQEDDSNELHNIIIR